MTDHAAAQPEDSDLSFDLTTRPWLVAQRCDGQQTELSLRDAFEQAGGLRRVVGDVPTQEFALIRLLLALAHDALEGPQDIDAWEALWEQPDCFAALPAYLDRHRDRFDLLHPDVPFFQVAELRTAQDEVASLNRIVADVPNGEPFFTARLPGVSRLSFAEAARWLVHAQAYDTSGIKTGAVGDHRVKKGKVYPLGVGWAGNLGGVLAEGRTLRETLLLNLVAADSPLLTVGRDDRPAWRRAPCGPGPATAEQRAERPSGVRDLYTWQSRRIRLHYDADGVHGVVLGYGDALAPHNMHQLEPMTGWRRSQAQEKKHGKKLVYMPREHDPARSVWRGLAALIANEEQDSAQGRDAAAGLRPGVLGWVSRLATEGVLPRGTLIRARTIGAVYGTQQSVIDEVIDDQVAMAVVLLHEQDRRYGQVAVHAVGDAEAAVSVLGDLAADLATASGSDTEPARAAARQAGFASLDGPYRSWLRTLADSESPYERRDAWQHTAHGHISRLGTQLLAAAGEAAWEGRTVETKKGTLWLNSASADLWFRSRLNRALPSAPLATASPGPQGNGPDSSKAVS